jgi:pyruvate/2-oxoglutarate dehydrogenase complex dihydrolipoamide acyltransferase (E2) component
VRVRSNPVTLHVQARPGDAKDGWFLPAKRVDLAQSWDPAKPTFRVGDAVSRTVVLRALGASSEQLPRFELPSIDGIRQYPEGTRDQTVPSDEGVISVLEQKIGLVPTRAGTLTLPAIEVQWFDVQSKQSRTATLPAETIEILPASGASTASAAAAAPQASSASAASVQKSAPAAAPAASAPTAPSAATASAEKRGIDGAGTPQAASWPHGRLVVPGVALAALLVAGSAWLALRRRRPAAAPENPAAQAAPRPRPSLDAVKRACQVNDPRAARDALLVWARATWPADAPGSLGAIARRLGHEGFRREVAALDAQLYGQGVTGWSGAALLRAFTEASASAGEAAKAEAPILPGLYPASRAA